MDATEMLGGDVMAIAAARGYVLAPWDRSGAEMRGRVLCYPRHATAPEQERIVLGLMLEAEANGDERASRVRLISAG